MIAHLGEEFLDYSFSTKSLETRRPWFSTSVRV